MQKFTIQSVGEHLQLPKSTIRYWEKEFLGLINPQRTAGGQRRYSIKDIAVLEAIQDLKKSGLSLSQIKQQLTKETNIDKGPETALIDQLAESIASAVRREIYQIFNKTKQNL